eukprot:1104511-Alexandrium_andersonii.AAC.1
MGLESCTGFRSTVLFCKLPKTEPMGARSFEPLSFYPAKQCHDGRDQVLNRLACGAPLRRVQRKHEPSASTACQVLQRCALKAVWVLDDRRGARPTC